MSLTLNGGSSDTYGLRLLSEIKFDSVERDTTIQTIPGRDGDVMMDNKRYKSLSFELDFKMTLTGKFDSIEGQISAAKQWLSKCYQFVPMTWTGEADFTFQARLTNKVTFDRMSPYHADVTIPLTLQPFKYLTSSLSAHAITSGTTLANLGSLPAKPVITLTGTGNVTLTVGGKAFILKNVTGGVVIDCEKQVVTDLTKSVSMMSCVYSYPFPVLGTGNTVISWDNTAFSASITERWCALA